MSKKELQEYFRWFLDMIPVRTNELAKAVRESPGFGIWQPDYSPVSLNMLGDWCANQIETRTRTHNELRNIKEGSAYPIEVPTEELTNRTISIAMDIGMYISQVFLRNHPSLRWAQQFGSKRSIDYAQPVLVEFNPGPFNPVQMMVSYAYGLASQKKTGEGLRNIYNIWSNMICSKD